MTGPTVCDTLRLEVRKVPRIVDAADIIRYIVRVTRKVAKKDFTRQVEAFIEEVLQPLAPTNKRLVLGRGFTLESVSANGGRVIRLCRYGVAVLQFVVKGSSAEVYVVDKP